jgi:toxin FitB
MTLQELEIGVLLVERRDPSQATALVHRMTVVTRNVSDFMPSGVPLLNPCE